MHFLSFSQSGSIQPPLSIWTTYSLAHDSLGLMVSGSSCWRSLSGLICSQRWNPETCGSLGLWGKPMLAWEAPTEMTAHILKGLDNVQSVCVGWMSSLGHHTAEIVNMGVSSWNWINRIFRKAYNLPRSPGSQETCRSVGVTLPSNQQGQLREL